MSDSPGSLASALYGPTGPAESPQGPTGIDSGKASWRGEPLDSLPAAASVPNQSSKAEPRSLGESIYPTETPPPTTPVSPTEAPPAFDRTTADPALLSEFDQATKALRLDGKGADRLLALHAKAVQAQERALTQQAETWANETRAHYGDSLDGTAKELRDRITGLGEDGKTFLRLMGETRLGNNLAVIRVLEQLTRGY